MGDDVQSMKAGLMEVADIFVINKTDYEGADRLEQQLAAMLQLAPEPDAASRPPVVRTTASTGVGVEALIAAIEEFGARAAASGKHRVRTIEHWKERLTDLLEEQIAQRALHGSKGQSLLDTLAGEVADRKKGPYTAVHELLARVGI
jgi:LAO/AO transport system kinase